MATPHRRVRPFKVPDPAPRIEQRRPRTVADDRFAQPGEAASIRGQRNGEIAIRTEAIGHQFRQSRGAKDAGPDTRREMSSFESDDGTPAHSMSLVVVWPP